MSQTTAAPAKVRAPARASKMPGAAAQVTEPSPSVSARTTEEHAGAHVLPVAPASIPVHASGGEASGFWRSQALAPSLPLQRKLAIGSSNDPLETEADAAAKAIVGRESGGAARRLRRVDVPSAEAPPLVHQVLRAPGQELDSETRSWAETAYQRDFGRVRIHTGDQAEASAASINARAYTVGSRIVLGPGAAQGGANYRTLMAHELAHVVQQGTAPTLAGRGPGETAMAPVRGATAPMVQRQEAEAQAEPADTGKTDLGWITEGIVVAASIPARAVGETAYDLAHATWHGFFAEIKEHGGEAASKVLGRVKEFVTSPKQLLLFFPKYWWGLIKGVVSPITGLFDLAKLGVQLVAIGGHAAETAWENKDKIAEDAKGLADSMRKLGGKAYDALKGLFLHPIDTVTGLLPLLEQAKADANAAAERGGHKAAGMLLAATDQPIPDLAEIAGEVIGTIVVNVALFVFTEGIGDAIVQIAGKLGEVGAWLGRFGKAAEMLGALVGKLGELLTTVGGWVTKGEALIGKLAGALLKPLEPVLEEFGELVGQLRTFLRDLLGVAEKAETQEAAAAAKALAKTAKEPHAPKLSGGETPPPPPKRVPPVEKPATPPPPKQVPPVEKPITPPPPKEVPPVEKPVTPPPPKEVPPVEKPTTPPPPKEVPPVEKPVTPPPPKQVPPVEKPVTPPGPKEVPPVEKPATPPQVEEKPPAPKQPAPEHEPVPEEKAPAATEEEPVAQSEAEEAEPAAESQAPEQQKPPEEKPEETPETETPSGPDEKALRKELKSLKAKKARAEDTMFKQENLAKTEAERAAELRRRAAIEKDPAKKARMSKDAAKAEDASQKALDRAEAAKKKAIDSQLEIQKKSLLLNKDLQSALPCFSEGTPVLTPGGARPIDTLRPDDVVLAYDFASHRAVPRRVLNVYRNKTERFYSIVANSKTVFATGLHRFWLEPEQRWVEARALQAGARLLDSNGESVAVDSIAIHESPGATTYNLHIEQFSTYFVGSGVLVHNAGAPAYNFGDLLIYEGTNPKFPGKIYIGQTDDIIRRRGEHRAEAETELRRTNLTPEEREFWKFKKDIELKSRVSGLDGDQADFLEQTNKDIETKIRGEKNVMNRREQVSRKNMPALEEKIKANPKVQEAGLCR